MFEIKVVAAKSLIPGQRFRVGRFDRRTRITKYGPWMTVTGVDFHPGQGVIIDTADATLVLPGLADVEVEA